MIYQRGSQTMDVGDNETTRQRILERAGWKRVETPAEQPGEELETLTEEETPAPKPKAKKNGNTKRR